MTCGGYARCHHLFAAGTSCFMDLMSDRDTILMECIKQCKIECRWDTANDMISDDFIWLKCAMYVTIVTPKPQYPGEV